VRLLLIRHGEHEQIGKELAALTPFGRQQAEALGIALESWGKPEAILCSHSTHAREHAHILAGLLARSVPVIPVTALTPNTAEDKFNVEGMFNEAGARLNFDRLHSIACVGHESRLSQLAQKMTGQQPAHLLDHGQFQRVEGESWKALIEGRGQLSARVPTGLISYGDNTELLSKIGSKMQVSALLAGFTSTAFGVILTESDYWASWSTGRSWPSGADGWRAVAMAASLVCLALATLLFVVSIYMYDRLSMPRRYWESDDVAKVPRQDLWRSFRRDRVKHGPVYAYMVWAWRFVFSPAVFMAMLGFFALVMNRGVWPIAGLFLLVTGVSIVYYLFFRPRLGVD
jgi:phosphohistidine phosphatase SixA